jgi:uncharacterized protein YbjT (DUF2867 family)
MGKKAIIAGATGLVGRHLVEELTTNPAYDEIIIISRRELAYQHPKLRTIISGFDQLNNLELPSGIDECFCSLGTTTKKSGKKGLKTVDHDYVLELASLTKKHGIKKFLVVSSQGANPKSAFYYMNIKGMMEKTLKTVGIEAVFILRPSLITGQREEPRWLEQAGYRIYKALEPLMVGKYNKLRPVSALKIARCMVNLAQGNKTGNHTIESDAIQNH